MKITKEGYLYQLAFMPRIFPVNCYLVEEETGLTLIDAALPFSSKGILEAAASIGKPITKIVLTHAHEDHVGALDSLKESLGNVPIYISSRDARLMENDRSLDPRETQTPIKGGVPKKLLARPDFFLEDGDCVGSLQAIHVPGHTPGSMAFLDIRSRAIIAGDAFQTRGGIAVAGDLKPMFPFPAFGTWCRKTALESGRKLASLKPGVLACGHGVMLKDPLEEMEKAIRRVERRIEKGV
ncbi:MBL fold metallo-hydrolase [Neobacillus piezotolerans]|uniref:MBL fold metallo-hydrolase n=1 Tax=Neobacillus piezotolerans TaxID=2259171 RepID=A0A3D8GQJ7_9BACI|nr:MBL fold metallo-hydrolase [Neobacillus piezotolerans]RDU36763.1 MBL fold metallo-hydrolase [Neobacillus piezotolerans]